MLEGAPWFRSCITDYRYGVVYFGLKAGQDAAYAQATHTCLHTRTHMHAKTHTAHTHAWTQTLKDNGKIDPASHNVLTALPLSNSPK